MTLEPGVGLVAARVVMEFIDHARTHAAQTYVEAQQLLLAESDRVRRDLLEDLLAGREPIPGPRLTAARAAGLDTGGRCLYIHVGRSSGARRCWSANTSQLAVNDHVPVTVTLSLAGLKPGTHTLKIAVSYKQTQRTHGHEKR